MKKTIVIIILALLSCSGIFAQKKAKEIKGDKYFQAYSFGKAIKKYRKVAQLTSDGLRKYAESCWHTGDLYNAERLYDQLVSSTDKTPEDIYCYAKILQTNGKTNESARWFDIFSISRPDEIRSVSYQQTKSELPRLMKDEGRFLIENLSFNTCAQDFGPAFYKNKVVFASSREGAKPISRKYNWNGKPFLNLYIAQKDSFQLGRIKSLGGIFNGHLHDGPASFNADGSLMAFTRNNYKAKGHDGVIRLEIFFSRFENNEWTEPEAFYLNNADYSVSHPCLSADGKTMYFASDMPGGIGGVDLYIVRRNENGQWSKPENLGQKINTEGDEMFPFIEENHKLLIFASNGRAGIGGLDLFISQYSGDGFTDPLNMGAPLNSSYDDFALILDRQFTGYFCSNRPEGRGDDDIYYLKILKPFIFGQTIKGRTKDKQGEILSGVSVKLYNESGTVIAQTISAPDGSYSFSVDKDRDFTLSGTLNKYFEGENTVSTKNNELVLIADLILEKDPGLGLYCLITDYDSKTPVEGVKIKLIDNKTGKVEPIFTPISGDFIKALPQSRLGDEISYTIVMEKEGYVPKTVTYEKNLNKEGLYNIHNELNLEIKKLEMGMDLAKVIEIKPIYFDLDKSNIRPDAAIELDKIVTIMNENPTMVIELGSHTDCRGSAAYNMALSDRRAKSSAEFIQKRISNPERIYGKGYGESRPVNSCACEGNIKSDCTEEQHQANRRTEFIIIKM